MQSKIEKDRFLNTHLVVENAQVSASLPLRAVEAVDQHQPTIGNLKNRTTMWGSRIRVVMMLSLPLPRGARIRSALDRATSQQFESDKSDPRAESWETHPRSAVSDPFLCIGEGCYPVFAIQLQLLYSCPQRIFLCTRPDHVHMRIK